MSMSATHERPESPDQMFRLALTARFFAFLVPLLIGSAIPAAAAASSTTNALCN